MGSFRYVQNSKFQKISGQILTGLVKLENRDRKTNQINQNAMREARSR